MRKLLPYEQIIEQRKDDMPLPSEDIAWHEMEKLLNKEDDDKIIVPPPRLWGCSIWLLSVLVLVGLAVWYFTKKNSPPELLMGKSKIDSSTIQASNVLQNLKVNDSVHVDQYLLKDSITLIDKNIISKQDTFSKENKKILSLGQVNQTSESGEDKNFDENIVNRGNENRKGIFNNAIINNRKIRKITNALTPTNTGVRKQINSPKLTHKSVDKRDDKIDKTEVINQEEDFLENNNSIDNKKKSNKWKNQIDQTIDQSKEQTIDLILQSIDSKSLIIKKEDIAKKIIINVKDIVVGNNEKNKVLPKKNKPPSYYFGAGLGMQQQIPINGVSSNSFNYYGRQNIISEYIPSAIIRLYKKDNWFVQAEFKHGAPQYNKDFNFINDSKVDSGFGTSNTITNTNFILKKSFYHQLPLSFHYNLSPRLSIGTGVVINNFFGAIAEKTVDLKRLFGTGNDTILFKGIVARKDVPDSNFKKMSFQTLLESQYKWKRLMFGLRYTIGLTPYITYTDNQNGTQNVKYHQNFNAFFRYELWNNKKRIKDISKEK
jgi:hypothetical protein